MSTPFTKYKSGTPYEITVAPDDTLQFKKRPKCRNISQPLTRLIDFHAYWVRFFRHKSVEPHIRCDLNVEISQPNVGDNNPRLHLHGTFVIRQDSDIIPWLLYILPSIQANSRVAINDYRQDYWPEYIKKDQYMFVGLYEPYAQITNSDTTVDFIMYGIKEEESSDTESEEEL